MMASSCIRHAISSTQNRPPDTFTLPDRPRRRRGPSMSMTLLEIGFSASSRSVVIALKRGRIVLAWPRSLKCASFFKFALSFRLGDLAVEYRDMAGSLDPACARSECAIKSGRRLLRRPLHSYSMLRSNQFEPDCRHGLGACNDLWEAARHPHQNIQRPEIA